MERPVIRVVGAIIERDGAVFAARRNAERSAGGLWEFPGGKIEAGETTVDALRPLESLAPCFLLCTGCAPVRTAPVWVPLEDRVQLALLLAKGYAALDSRPYGGSLALALYPLKETE